MLATVTKVTPIYPNSTFVQWTISDPDNALLNFVVLRAGSPTGPFETLSSNLTDAVFSYMDVTAHHLGLTTKIWYAIKAIPLSGALNSVTSDPVTAQVLTPVPRARLANKMRRDLDITLKRFSGVRILILKRKRFGQRCTVCYNDVTKDVVLSHCESCYGTSFDTGYHTAYETWGKFDPAMVQSGFDRTGDTDLSTHGITMLDYPDVETDDVIVESSTNRRFRVLRKAATESRRELVHQTLQVSELSRSAVEYTIPATV